MSYAPKSFMEFSALRDMLAGDEAGGGRREGTSGHRRDGSRSSSSSSSTVVGPPSKKEHLTDKLLERLFAAALPADSFVVNSADVKERLQDQKDRPAFSVALMARNFRRLNARVGCVFRFQYRIVKILTWKHPTHTLSALAVYSLVCLHPYLLTMLPVAAVVLGMMVPAFAVRHPPPPSDFPSFPVVSGGPPLADAPEIRPVPELSKDFFINMRDIQNAMDDFATLYDRTLEIIGGPLSFKDESYSSALYLVLLLSASAFFLLAAYIPWRVVFMVSGWLMVAMGHPHLRLLIKNSHQTYLTPQEERVGALFDYIVASDIVMDEPPECLLVEVFELQRRGTDVNEWEDWLYSPSPYERLSAARVSQNRPTGVRFLDEIQCPPGWRFPDNSVWKLDLHPRLWVQQRSVQGCDVDSDSKWVYDYDDGARGEWRRRRWLRTCERYLADDS
ncbi:integral peroxisomal membrane peroxin-domain-containing protein [Dipodascopsis tothii]|uniref:integral peroxisomal membrane peroxin-domain-containing protein n=1 Tax=Dipodascopsis tothii TaxID=44089 RepID=UPI0034CD9533